MGNQLFGRGSEWRLSSALERRQRGRLIFPAQRTSSGVRHLGPSKLIFSVSWMSHELAKKTHEPHHFCSVEGSIEIFIQLNLGRFDLGRRYSFFRHSRPDFIVHRHLQNPYPLPPS